MVYRARVLPTLLFIFVLLAGACESQEQPRSSESGTSRPGPADPAAERPSLLYLKNRQLIRYDLSREKELPIATLPTPDVTVAPGGEHLAYVIPARPSPGDEDFVAHPELHLYDLDTGADVTVGPGSGALWDGTGERFAFLEPVGPRICEGETCTSESKIVVGEIGSETRTTIGAPGRWSLLGWVGDRVLASDQDSTKAVFVSANGYDEASFAPSEFWGASPDGSRVLLVEADGVRLQATNGSGSQSIELEGTLGEGAWAPDGSRVAAVLLGPGRPSVALVDAEGGSSEEISASEGAAGQVLWAPDGAGLAFVRSAAKGLRLEAVHCEDPPGRCRALFDWARGVRLLALT